MAICSVVGWNINIISSWIIDIISSKSGLDCPSMIHCFEHALHGSSHCNRDNTKTLELTQALAPVLTLTHLLNPRIEQTTLTHLLNPRIEQPYPLAQSQNWADNLLYALSKRRLLALIDGLYPNHDFELTEYICTTQNYHLPLQTDPFTWESRHSKLLHSHAGPVITSSGTGRGLQTQPQSHWPLSGPEQIRPLGPCLIRRKYWIRWVNSNNPTPSHSTPSHSTPPPNSNIL